MKNDYLIVDDILETDNKPIPKEILESAPIPKSGKVIYGTLGTFSIKDFENMTEGLKK